MQSPYPDAAIEAEQFLANHAEINSFHMIFTDLCGVQRGKFLRREELLAVYRNGRFMPGSILSLDITGADVCETGLVWEDGDADRYAWPVPGSLLPIPWLADGRSAQFMTSLFETDGRPVAYDPRQVLQQMLQHFTAMDLTPVAAIELEFYLFDQQTALAGEPKPPQALTNTAVPRHFQAYLLQDLDDFAPFFSDLYAACAVQGLPARALISEYSPGQMEVVLRHQADAMLAADQAIIFKRLIRAIAEKHGLLASFMAKPYSQYSGCGMHVHTSLNNAAGENIFAAATPQESTLMLQAIAGLKDTIADAMLIFAPNANSYRRFRKASYAPNAPTWGINNRTVSVRVPLGSGEAMHIEHRPAGADANPYLVLAATLAGMHYGMMQQLDPGAPVTGNGYALPAEPMPSNWYAAAHAFRESTFIREYFGEKFQDVFATIKEVEADRFYAEPTSLDYQWYLRTV